jgi:hypothetical protein
MTLDGLNKTAMRDRRLGDSPRTDRVFILCWIAATSRRPDNDPF